MLYQIVLALHLISVISWFAGLFYLPRLFVYHTENKEKNACTHMLETMERKLFKIIMMPAMVLTWGFGVWLVLLNSALAQGGWFHAKMTFVLLLTVYHFSLNFYRKQLLAGQSKKSSAFFRLYNEVPTLLMVLVVFLVVLKPF